MSGAMDAVAAVTRRPPVYRVQVQHDGDCRLLLVHSTAMHLSHSRQIPRACGKFNYLRITGSTGAQTLYTGMNHVRTLRVMQSGFRKQSQHGLSLRIKDAMENIDAGKMGQFKHQTPYCSPNNRKPYETAAGLHMLRLRTIQLTEDSLCFWLHEQTSQGS